MKSQVIKLKCTDTAVIAENPEKAYVAGAATTGCCICVRTDASLRHPAIYNPLALVSNVIVVSSLSRSDNTVGMFPARDTIQNVRPADRNCAGIWRQSLVV